MNMRHPIWRGLAALIMTSPLFSQEVLDGFLEDFELKYASLPPAQENIKTSTTPTVTVTIDAIDTLGKVSKYIYGNNANLWMSQMVDQDALINYITLLSPNIIRFPGGNISNVYFWDAAVNHPPDDVPDSLFDGNGNKVVAFWWYGKNTGSWTLSLDHYYQMLEMTYSTGIICVNFSYSRYGTGPDPVATAAHYAAEWVRYDDGRTKFWEIGNEDSGPWQAGYQIDTTLNQDGQPEIITGEIYGKHFKVFADSMRQAAEEIGSTIYIGAQLIAYDARSSWIPAERTWNSGFFTQAGNAADFFIVHSYYTNYNENSTATTVLNSATTQTISMMNYVKQSTTQNQVVMKPLALTEWNIFAVGSKQACSYINGMHATIVLGELAKNKYSMSSRWDLANGYDNGNDHGMFNTGDEAGLPKWNPRPAFFYMYYFQKFFGDHIVNSTVSGSTSILAYASRFHSGEAGIVVINKGTTEQCVKLVPNNYGYGEWYYVYSLYGGSDNGEFSQVVYVNDAGPTNATGGPIDGLENIAAWSYITGDEIKFISPPRSVQYIMIEPGENTPVGDEKNWIKNEQFHLYQNFPNPFNPRTIIRYNAGANNHSPLQVDLSIYNLLGQKIITLVSGKQTAGLHEAEWNAAGVASGVYLYRLQCGGYSETKKLILMR
jgi:hypothetical protein